MDDWDEMQRALMADGEKLSAMTGEDHGPWCPRCVGNGELITDWERYLHDENDADGDKWVTECPDCNGTGRLTRPHPTRTIGGWNG